MKVWNRLLKLAAVFAALAGAVCLLIAYWDKLVELCPSCDVLKDKTCSLKKKLPTPQQLKEKLPNPESIKSKLSARKAEIEAEFADYADVEPLAQDAE